MHIRLTFQDGHTQQVDPKWNADPVGKAAIIVKAERKHGRCVKEEFVVTPELARFGVR